MSDYRFGLDDYSLNYYPKEAANEDYGVDWDKVESVEIEWIDFVRERTCKVESSLLWDCYHGRDFYEHRLSCGHTITSDDEEPPNYCGKCGRKVQK